MMSPLVYQTDSDPSVVATLVVDLENPEGLGAASGREVRAATRLTIEPYDLDNVDQAVGIRGGATERFRIKPGSAAASPAGTCA
jgi:hypothetical protein